MGEGVAASDLERQCRNPRFGEDACGLAAVEVPVGTGRLRGILMELMLVN